MRQENTKHWTFPETKSTIGGGRRLELQAIITGDGREKKSIKSWKTQGGPGVVKARSRLKE